MILANCRQEALGAVSVDVQLEGSHGVGLAGDAREREGLRGSVNLPHRRKLLG